MEISRASLQDAPELKQGLTREEDDELRRLNYFGSRGSLVGQKLERFLELRLRDRRGTVRPPREFIEEEQRLQAESAGRRFLAWRNR